MLLIDSGLCAASLVYSASGGVPCVFFPSLFLPVWVGDVAFGMLLGGLSKFVGLLVADWYD